MCASCAYPRRAISLNPASVGDGSSTDAPSEVWQLTIVGAVVPPEQRSGLPWDDGDGPDVYVRVLREGSVIFQTAVLENTFAPEWNAIAPTNLSLPHDSELRIEVFDADGVARDPVGIVTSHGLPENALPGAAAVIALDSPGASVRIRVDAPRAYRGIGIRSVEERSDALIVLEMEAHSPAGRAGIVVGDRVTKIGSQSVALVGGPRASSLLSQMAGRGGTLTIETSDGEIREVQLDQGFTWLVL
jgi:C2 domain/PDZ domain